MDKLLHLRWISTVKSTAWKDPVHEQNISKTQRNVIFTALVLRNGAWLFLFGQLWQKISRKPPPSAALIPNFLHSKKLCPLLHSTYCLSGSLDHLEFLFVMKICMHFFKQKKVHPSSFHWCHGPQEVCVFVEVCANDKMEDKNRLKTSATNGKDRIKVLPNKAATLRAWNLHLGAGFNTETFKQNKPMSTRLNQNVWNHHPGNVDMKHVGNIETKHEGISGSHKWLLQNYEVWQVFFTKKKPLGPCSDICPRLWPFSGCCFSSLGSVWDTTIVWV